MSWTEDQSAVLYKGEAKHAMESSLSGLWLSCVVN